MGKAPDPDVYYPLLIAAYREEPNNHFRAAKAAGINWGTAQKAWTKGHKTRGFGPISILIKSEQERARALIEQERQALIAAQKTESKQARDNAVIARKQEGQMTAMVRGSTFLALRAVTALSKESNQLAEVINKQVATERLKLEQWNAYEDAIVKGAPNAAALAPGWSKNAKGAITYFPPTLERLLSILNKSAEYASKVTHCARQAMEMERLHLGEPIATIAVVDERKEITFEEMDTRRENALRALDMARTRRGLQVIPGGKIEPVVGQRVVLR